MSDKNWTPEQTAIFTELREGTGNVVVRARAGTGKTTTIVAALGFLLNLKVLLCAFNKRIATELNGRVDNPDAEVKTLHALGFAFVRKAWTGVKVDNKREELIVRAFMPHETPDQIIRLVAKLATLAKGSVPHAARGRDLFELAYAMDCVPNDGLEAQYSVEDVCCNAVKCMLRSKRRDGGIANGGTTCSFADMIWLPLAQGWTRAWYDVVIVDEAQDMNAAQLELAQKACKADGRIVIVGDDCQAIYAFRGADSEAIDRMKAELDATELPLTVTFRCPRLVVAEAAQLVPDYRCGEGTPDGTIRELNCVDGDPQPLTDDVQPGDFVLSRKNAPLAAVCLAILRQGKRARITGRDVGKGLVALVRKLSRRAGDFEAFLTKLSTWQDREIAKANASKAKNADTRIQYVEDQADTLRALSEGLATPAELETRINELFSDVEDGAAVTCSSVHRAKGLEADRVFVLADTLYPKRGNPTEERNIHYVAITRTKRELIMVNGLGQ